MLFDIPSPVNTLPILYAVSGGGEAQLFGFDFDFDCDSDCRIFISSFVLPWGSLFIGSMSTLKKTLHFHKLSWFWFELLVID